MSVERMGDGGRLGRRFMGSSVRVVIDAPHCPTLITRVKVVHKRGLTLRTSTTYWARSSTPSSIQAWT